MNDGLRREILVQLHRFLLERVRLHLGRILKIERVSAGRRHLLDHLQAGNALVIEIHCFGSLRHLEALIHPIIQNR